MSRAVIIVTDGLYVDGVTLRKGVGGAADVAEDVWLETSPQLLADLRTLTTECLHGDLASLRDAAARVRALLPGEGET